MKKIILAIITLSTLFVACQKDEEQDTVNLTAIAADNNSVNAKYYINGHYGCWQDTDRVVINGDNYKLKVVNTSTATIENVVENTSVGYTAGYPASQVSNMINGVSVEFNLPETQYYKTTKIASGEATTAQDIINPMIAYCEPGGSVLKFYNVASVLKLNITNTTGAPIQVHYVMVESETSNLCGTGTVNVSSLAGANPAPVLTVDGSTKSVTLDCCAEHPSIANGSTLPVYIVLPAFGSSESKEHLTFTVLAQDASKKKYTFTKSTNTISGHEGLFLERSQIVNATLNLTKDMGGDAEAFWGKGTSGCPYLITSYADLVKMRNYVNHENLDSYDDDKFNSSSAYYKQTADIDIAAGAGSSTNNWTTAIGKSSTYPFKAHYNGGEHAISHLNSVTSLTTSFGLFGYANGATIENLDISGYLRSTALKNFGGLLGETTGNAVTIQNCDVSAIVNHNNSNSLKGTYGIGGVLGKASVACTVNNCTFTGVVRDSSSAPRICLGGILGHNASSGTYISDCENSAIIENAESASNSYGWFGGICAHSQNASIHIDNCSNSGLITCRSKTTSCDSYVGGILGSGCLKDGSESIVFSLSGCSNSGTLTSATSSRSCLGGIIGAIVDSVTSYTATVNISNCTNAVSLSGYTSGGNSSWKQKIGGILGYAFAKNGNVIVNVTSCENSGTITSLQEYSYAGGYCGNTR